MSSHPCTSKLNVLPLEPAVCRVDKTQRLSWPHCLCGENREKDGKVHPKTLKASCICWTPDAGGNDVEHNGSGACMSFLNFFFNSQNYADLPVMLFLSASCMLMYQISLTSGTKDRGETTSPATSRDLRRTGRSRLRVPLPIGEATQDLPKHPDLGRWPSCLYPYWSSKQEWVTSSGIWEKKRGAWRPDIPTSPHLPLPLVFSSQEFKTDFLPHSWASCIHVYSWEEAVSFLQCSVLLLLPSAVSL